MRACHSRSSASTAVLAALIAVQPLTGAAALAQAFQGNATTILGGASRFFGPAGTETIVIDGAQATINWTPSDSGGGGAPINFLPAGNTADFISAQQGAFTVLNRIIAADPSRVIALNGAVTATPGGNVWFYAPGGLLIGATASFNVGGLLLTANDPVGAAQGLPFLTGSAQNQFGLAAAPGSTAGVTVAAGAQIRAATDGSYFLAVAPRISFAGSAVVNGSAALVQAEAVDFTLNGGLFDITATIGSDVSAMTVGGSITGPAAKAAGDARRIYLMAVPKNNAITLLLTAGAGDIGFDIAGAADVVGNTIVLSAGHNIQSGAGDDLFGARVGTGTASIIVSGRNVTSRLIGRAATDAIVTADTGNASFAADVTLFAGGEASINAQAGRTVTIGGNVLLDASASGASGDASGRTAAVRASGGGSIEVSGDVSALANGFGSGFQGQGAAGDGKGGTALLSLASGGSLTARNLVLEARGLGGAGFSGADGGRGDGGTARIDVSGGILGLAGNAQLTAVGVGGLSDGGRAGDGQGKLAEIVGDAGADINVNGAIEVFADGSSEDVDAQAAFKSGDGGGGDARVRIGASSKLSVGSDLMIAANGNGNRGAGGVGKGGTALAEIFGAGGTLLVGGGLMVNANGGGGTGFGSPTPAGDGVGGNARAELLGGQLTIKGDAGLLLSATGVGGSGFGGARGGSGFSGAATLLLDAGGDVSVSQSANIDVSSTGGSSSFIAGNALVRDGGGVQLRLGAGNAPARLFVGGDLSVVAGADGGTASAPGIGGDARGADVRLDILSGLADVAGAIAVDSDAQGGGGTTGGAAQGGTVSAMLAGGGAAPGLGRITIAVDARGGNGAAGDSIGDGGSATGGSINLVVGAGSQLIGPALLQVLARGGSSVDGDGGGATGGNLSLRAEGAQARLSGPVVLISESFGGDGSARGGDSAGGAISLDALAGGQLQVGAPGIKGSALAMAQGGFGSVGTGGNANPLELGGGVTARATGSGSVLAFVGDMLLQTGGQGGGGRSGGGNGKGSGITLATNGGRMEALGLVVADAGGAGGSASSAGNGGSGRSGNIDIRIQGLAGTDSMALGGVQASAIGRGGLGSNNADGTGGNGGDAFGGKVTIGAAGSAGQFSAGQTIVVADAFGGGGGGGGDGGNGGDAVGGEVLIGTGTAASAAGGQFAWTSMDASANAFGGSGGPGDAGGSNGNIGGARAVSSRMVINGGNATVTGDAVLTARASGGNAPVIGGLAELAVAPGLASKLTISGAARLSSAASAVNPAASVAGAARVTAIGGALELASLDVSVSGNTLAPDAAPTVLAAGTGGTITATGAAQVIARTEVALGDAGTMTFGGELRVAAGENLRQGIAGLPASFGPIRAGRLVLNAGGNIIIASTLTADGEGQIFTGGDISLGNVKAGTILTVQGRSITAGAVRGDEWARLFSSETMTLGSLSAGVIAQMFADGALVVGNVDAGISAPPAGTTGDIYLRSLASISAGTLTSSGNAGAAAAGIITTGTVSAGNIAVQLSGGDITNGGFVLPATGTIYLGNFSQRPLISFAGVAADYTALLAAVPTVVPGRVTINGNVATGRITANAADALRIGGSLTAAIGATLSGQSLTLGDITAAGFLDFTSRSDLTIGNLVAAGAVTFAVTGNIVTGAVQSGGSISLTATQDAAGLGGAIATGALTADDDIRLSSTGNLTTGALTALDSVFLTALTPQRLPATLPVITTGNIRTGAVERRGLVFINSAGSVVSGNISATGSVGVIGQGGPVTTGTIATGSSPIVLLDPGGITTGALSTSNAGAIFIANHALLPQITFDQAGNPQYAALLASVPVRLDGFVTIGGPATTGRFVSASTGAFSAQAITAAQSVTIDSGALATLAGNVAAPTITVTSRDIVIGAGALIGGGNTSAITLGASNDAGASIGGTGGTGYSLDNAEFGRLRASNITVRLAGSTLMTIGDLTLTGSGAASAGNRISLIADGGIRVAGLVTMANAGPADVLALTAGTRLEVITDAGGIRLGSSGDTPAGNLEISSGDVWVVTAAVQAQLAQNSNFAGRDRLLGLAPTTPDLAGRLVAGRIQISALRTVLIQNTGSAFARAAFTAGSLAVRAGSDQAGALLDVVINGRIAGDAGFIINNQTRDVVSFLPATDNLTLTSSVNGCLIRGVCSAGADNQAIATIINNIAELTQPREEEREKLSRSLPQLPIIIQQQLIDLTELFADPDIDDPVTSSGNPSLWQDNRLGSRPATGGQK